MVNKKANHKTSYIACLICDSKTFSKSGPLYFFTISSLVRKVVIFSQLSVIRIKTIYPRGKGPTQELYSSSRRTAVVPLFKNYMQFLLGFFLLVFVGYFSGCFLIYWFLCPARVSYLGVLHLNQKRGERFFDQPECSKTRIVNRNFSAILLYLFIEVEILK